MVLPTMCTKIYLDDNNEPRKRGRIGKEGGPGANEPLELKTVLQYFEQP